MTGLAAGGGHMGRHSLRLTIVLGALITVVGSTGIFAVFTDRSTSGPNTVTSDALPQAADLKIAVAADVGGAYLCDRDNDGQFEPAESTIAWTQDNTLIGQFSVANLQPGDTTNGAMLCLHNAGSSALSLTATALDLLDVDVDCTGDEQAAGDTDCGPGPAGIVHVGELSTVIAVDLMRVTCELSPAFTHQVIGTASSGLADFNGLALGAGTLLQPGQTTCILSTVRYPSTTAAADQQRAQSDRTTWRFAFDGVAS
jgi:hypothetical protein